MNILRLIVRQHWSIFCSKFYPTPYIHIGSYDTEALCMSLKVIINDSSVVIVICKHSTTSIVLLQS